MIARARGRSIWRGAACTLAGAALWGVSGTCMQLLTTAGALPAALVTLLRTAIGGLILVTFLFVCKRDQLRAVLRCGRDILPLGVFTVALYANQLCYAETVRLTNAGTATVLQMLSAIAVMAFVCVVGRRPPRVREAIGLMIALVATALIATQGNLSSLSMPPDGLTWGLVTAAATAVYILVPKYSGIYERYGAVVVVGVSMLACFFLALPGYAIQGGSLGEAAGLLGSLDVVGWLVLIVGLGAVGTALAYALYLSGVSMVGPVAGSLLAAVEPVSATVVSALALGTAFSGCDIIGMVLMCVMVFLIG